MKIHRVSYRASATVFSELRWFLTPEAAEAFIRDPDRSFFQRPHVSIVNLPLEVTDSEKAELVAFLNVHASLWAGFDD